MLLHILSFNLGVEIGQVIALAVMLGALRYWQSRPHFPVFAKIANTALIAAGALLLTMQLHGYSHSTYSEDFPISRDDHSHAHLEMSELGHSHNPDGSHPPESSQTGESHSHGPNGEHTNEPAKLPSHP